MIDINKKYKKMSKEVLRRKIKKAEEFKEWQEEYSSKYDEPAETSGIEYVPEEWLKEQGIIVELLTKKEEYFISAISGHVIRGEKITEHQNKYLLNIIDKCELLKKLDTSPLFKEYRKERDKL